MNTASDSRSEDTSASPDRSADLDTVGAKAIELYQNQLSLTDRIWAYFSQYSALLIVLACLLGVFRSSAQIIAVPVWARLLPLASYCVFAFGNHKVLALTLDELLIIRGIAVTKTRYKFAGLGKGPIVRFHVLLSLVVAGIYLLACLCPP